MSNLCVKSVEKILQSSNRFVQLLIKDVGNQFLAFQLVVATTLETNATGLVFLDFEVGV